MKTLQSAFRSIFLLVCILFALFCLFLFYGAFGGGGVSSPELKAQVSFSDTNFVVNFHFFIFFSRTTGPISTKLGKTRHPWEKGFKFLYRQDHVLFKGDIIGKQRKCIHLTKFKILLVQNHNGAKHPWEKGIQVCSNEWRHLFSRRDNSEIKKIH